MLNIPHGVEDRLIAGLKKFQPIVRAGRAQGVNEADLVATLADVFADVFGYDKCLDITSECAVREVFCGLAIKLENKIEVLVEVKGPGISLHGLQARQAIDYAGNQGVDWVVLTNGVQWHVYKVIFAQPIGQELVCEFDFLALSEKNDDHLQLLYLLTKEVWSKAAVNSLWCSFLIRLMHASR